MGTIYVYSPDTGRVSYTIDNSNQGNLSTLTDRGVAYYHGAPGEKIIGTYVTQNTISGTPDGVSPLRVMSSLVVDKTSIVGNGTDTATISGIVPNTLVRIPKDDFNFTSNTTMNFIEISSNGYSLNASENRIAALFSNYGYIDASVTINITSDV